MMSQDSSRNSTNCSIALATAAELTPGSEAEGGTDHRVSRLAARRAIRAALPGAFQIRIEQRRGSAPSVAGAPAPIALSLTHCDGRAAAIVAPAPARIGIDLEREDAASPDHTRFFLTPRERRALDTRSPAELWALKEAAWKALALPDDTCFHDLELGLDDTGSVEAVRLLGTTFGASAALTSPWSGYVLAAIELHAPLEPATIVIEAAS